MPDILVESGEGVARVTLNRPDKLNAFAGAMRQELLDALSSIAADADTRVVVITGAGRAFCSGGDVGAMSTLQKERDLGRFSDLLEAGAAIVTKIREMPQFVIAMVNGVAAGAGCNLALACDYRIGSQEAKFGETFVRIGLHPDWGGTWFLPRLVGSSKALEIMMTGRMVEAEEALQIGILDRLVAAEALEPEVSALSAAISAGPPIPLRAIKAAVYRSQTSSLDEQLALESANQREAFSSAAAAEGMAAFFEKRRPRFGNR